MNVRASIGSCIVATLALVALLLADMPTAAGVAKILASSSFLLVAWQAGARLSRYGRVLLVGLGLSFLGDTFLIGDSRFYFLSGLSAFLLAHVAYIAAFAIKGINWRWAAMTAVPVTIIAAFVFGWLNPNTPDELKIPVLAYTVVISLMVISATGTLGLGASPLILGGALMFFVSDLSVAALRIAGTDFPTYVWGLPLYYGGQLLLALSVSQSRSH